MRRLVEVEWQRLAYSPAYQAALVVLAVAAAAAALALVIVNSVVLWYFVTTPR